MSVEAMSWAFAQPIAPAPKLVLLAIANAANKSGYGFPGLASLVESCAPMQLRAVQRHVRTLSEMCLVRVESRYTEIGKQTANGYQLAMPGIDTTCWGEGVTSDRGRGCHSLDRERVSQLGQGEGVIAVTPTEDLNHHSNVTPNCIVGPKPDTPHELWVTAERILGYLNTTTGRSFLPRLPNKDPTISLKLIHGLLRHGYTEEQITQVIDNRVRRWKDDPEMREFLRPATLFRASNFEQYLGGSGSLKPPGNQAQRSMPRVDRSQVVSAPTNFREMIEMAKAKGEQAHT